MADGTSIEWTDATVNYVNGCSVLSPGCTNCYAMRLAGTRLKHHPSREGLTIDTKAGPVWNGVVRPYQPALEMPLRWRRPRQIFWNAHGDLFHDSVPDEVIDRQFAVMALTPHHIHQVLTKRADRMREYVSRLVKMDADERDRFLEPHAVELTGSPCAIGILEERDWPLPNVWLGVSVEDQTRAVERVPELLSTPAAVRWLSCEPLLGAVDLRNIPYRISAIDLWLMIDALEGQMAFHSDYDIEPSPIEKIPAKIDWVVVGGESGLGASHMHPDWARSLRDQCAVAGTAFHFKQWGNWAPGQYQVDVEAGSCDIAWPDGTIGGGKSSDHGGLGTTLYPRTKKQAGRLLDGVEHNGFPA